MHSESSKDSGPTIQNRRGQIHSQPRALLRDNAGGGGCVQVTGCNLTRISFILKFKTREAQRKDIKAVETDAGWEDV